MLVSHPDNTALFVEIVKQKPISVQYKNASTPILKKDFNSLALKFLNDMGWENVKLEDPGCFAGNIIATVHFIQEWETQLEQYVDEGANFLTEHLPGWTNVDALLLDMGTSDNCMLGQLFGDYWDGLKWLALSGKRAIQLGFALDGTNLEKNERRERDEFLTKCWARKIRELNRENYGN